MTMFVDEAVKALVVMEVRREDLVVEAREVVVEERSEEAEEEKRGEKEVRWQRRKAGLRGIAFFRQRARRFCWVVCACAWWGEVR